MSAQLAQAFQKAVYYTYSQAHPLVQQLQILDILAAHPEPREATELVKDLAKLYGGKEYAPREIVRMHSFFKTIVPVQRVSRYAYQPTPALEELCRYYRQQTEELLRAINPSAPAPRWGDPEFWKQVESTMSILKNLEDRIAALENDLATVKKAVDTLQKAAKPAAAPAAKPAEKPGEQPAAKPAEQPGAKPAEKPDVKPPENKGPVKN